MGETHKTHNDLKYGYLKYTRKAQQQENKRDGLNMGERTEQKPTSSRKYIGANKYLKILRITHYQCLQ